jgi:acetyl esterase/lipase
LAVSIVPALATTFSYTTYSNVPYGSDDEQVMDIYVPTGTASPNPTILLVHGGGWVSGDKAELTSSAEYFASQGYTAANINYRLATDTSNQYPTADNDTVQALQFVQSHAAVYQVDKTHISAFGTSAGASLALTLGTEHLVNGVMDFYGPTDFTDQNLLNDTFNNESNAAILMTVFGVGLPQGYTLYFDASPINNLSASFPPTIIFHGELDNTVPYMQSVNLNTALTQTWGVVSDLNLEPTLGHGFLTDGEVADPTTFLAQCTAFLEANPSVITLNFTNWASSYSLAGGPADMPENDGVPNLEKYLFGINPSAPMSAADRAALPTVGTTKISGTTYLTLTYRQYALETGVTVAVQSSTNLQTWTTDTNPGDQPQPTGNTDSVTGDPFMQARVPFVGPRKFIRLSVTQ